MLDARSEPKAQRDFAWNQSSLQSMLDLVASNNLCEITVYTNPEGNQVRDRALLFAFVVCCRMNTDHVDGGGELCRARTRVASSPASIRAGRSTSLRGL